jgi:fatty acid desaturase
MAVRLEAWIGSSSRVDTTAQSASPRHVLTLDERRAKLQRRRRRSRAHAALEGVVWLAGSGVVILLALGGVFGLR